VGISTGDQNHACRRCVCHPPPHLLCQWPFYLYTRQELDTYEFIIFVNYMNSYVTGNINSYFLCMNSYLAAQFVMCRLWRHLTHRSSYEFICGTSHINAAYHYCPDKLGCVWLPRPVRVRSAAPTSWGKFGCPDQLGCAR